jgi:hypothetical protein
MASRNLRPQIQRRPLTGTWRTWLVRLREIRQAVNCKSCTRVRQTRLLDQDQRCSYTRTKTAFQLNARLRTEHFFFFFKKKKRLHISPNACFISDHLFICLGESHTEKQSSLFFEARCPRCYRPLYNMHVPCSLPVTNIHSEPRVRGLSLAARKSTHPPDRYGAH